MAIKILLADDHMLIRRGIKQILEMEDDFVVVAEAIDGEQTLRNIALYKPDIVLMDMNMPKLSGLQVMKKLNADGIAAKVIFLTVEDADVLEVVNAGAAGYLLKDVESAMLVQAIRLVNEGESFIYPTLTKKLLGAMQRKDEKQRGNLHSGIEQLSERECEVLRSVAEGLSNQEISERMFLSEKTVKNHMTNIFRKMNVSDRTQAVVQAIKQGIVKIEQLP